MKAIILAAGMGTRLGKYTKDLPKGMLQFAGKSLIQRQVDTLRSCGIDDISIIRGYMPEKIQIDGVKYFENKEFSETNMVETLMKAESELNGEIIVCYADIIYERSILQAVLDNKSKIGVVVDEDYWPYWEARLEKPEEDVESLVIKDNKIVELGTPDCDLDKTKHRYVGLIKFSKSGVEILKEVYHKNKEKYYDSGEKWMASKSFKQAYMTCMLNAIIKAGNEINPIIISKGWLEFDTNEDYEKATEWNKNNTLKRFFNLENT